MAWSAQAAGQLGGRFRVSGADVRAPASRANCVTDRPRAEDQHARPNVTLALDAAGKNSTTDSSFLKGNGQGNTSLRAS